MRPPRRRGTQPVELDTAGRAAARDELHQACAQQLALRRQPGCPEAPARLGQSLEQKVEGATPTHPGASPYVHEPSSS